MKRREAIRTLSLAAIIGTAGAVTMQCSNTANDSAEDADDPLQNKADSATQSPETPDEPLSERDKLITNRQKMEFQDPENPTDFELKHTPKIVLKEKDERGFTPVEIIIGSEGIIHPTEEGHWIDYISLYLDDQFLGKMEFTNGVASGYTVFKFMLDGGKVLKAEAGCNLHGIWNNSVELTS